jgi:hypothetical protein
MKVTCGVCSLEKNSTDCEVVVLSDQEKRDIADKGLEAQDRYFYCKPCWQLMHSGNAIDLMANQYESQLFHAGVPKGHSKELADKYRQRLQELARKHGRTQG